MTTGGARFTAAVIGLGRIGQGYDYDEPGDARVATHATAFARHAGYELLAGIDPDPARRERFERKFARATYADVDALLAHARPDVVAVAVPTAQHLPVIERALAGRPQAIVCEKPIASRRVDAERIVALAAERGAALVVNYMRRFEPGVLALKQALARGAVGEIVKGTAWYTKGLRENGSHFVDLLRFLLGEVTDARVLEPGRELGDDAEPDACIRFGKAPVYVLAARDECFALGELMLLGTLGTVRYADGGALIEIRTAMPARHDASARRLAPHAQRVPTDIARYQWHVADALYRHLTAGTPLASEGRSATETLAVVEAVLEERERW